MAILDNSRDDLRALISTIEAEELLEEDADTKILALLTESYEQFLVQKVPDVLEENFYDSDTRRKKGESMTIFLQRKRQTCGINSSKARSRFHQWPWATLPCEMPS